jgi:D-aminoacyl-tRNA deacylase
MVSIVLTLFVPVRATCDGNAVAPGPAKELFDSFCSRVRRDHDAEKVAEGVFGAMMEVALVNDGPVTMCIDSKDRKGTK